MLQQQSAQESAQTIQESLLESLLAKPKAPQVAQSTPKPEAPQARSRRPVRVNQKVYKPKYPKQLPAVNPNAKPEAGPWVGCEGECSRIKVTETKYHICSGPGGCRRRDCYAGKCGVKGESDCYYEWVIEYQITRV